MDKHQKIQLKKYITYAIIALIVVVLAVMPLIATQNVPADGPQASFLSTTAEYRTIRTQLIGGGLLKSDATEDLTIPAEVKLVEYLVENGDSVRQGDPIARVDKVTVQSALVAVQETLDHLTGELADAGSNSDNDEVKAHAGGLVKILYGKKGDSVREVMLEHGALAVLSLDGRMAVDLECGADLNAGTAVLVTRTDGTQVEGNVESCTAGLLTVSVKDKGYAIGETVSVHTKEGLSLGKGKLYIHNAWNAAAYYGTISMVNVKEGTTVSAGKSLFSLDVSDYSLQFQILSAQRQEYEDLMQELFQMYASGVISAPCDGVVTGVDKDGTFLLSAQETSSSGWSVMPLNHTASGPEYARVSFWNPDWTWPPTEENTCTKSENCTASQHDPACPRYEEGSSPENPDAQRYTGYLGKVSSIEGGIVTLKVTEQKTDVTLESLSPPGDEELTGTQIFAGTVYSDGTAIALGDTVFLTEGGQLLKISGSGGTESGGTTDAPTQQPGTGGMGGMGGMSGMGILQTPSFEPYSLETLTIASVTSQEKMSLEITIDEQDIHNLSLGQEATITVEALTGQTFPAVVTSISNTGSNEGGSSKFTARLTLSKSGTMLPGMNASAYLTLNTAADTLSIPVAALVELGDRTVVYTLFNEEKELLKQPVEVTTGLSDGEYVQILSGLNAGDTVWYAYYDTPEISNVPESILGF